MLIDTDIKVEISKRFNFTKLTLGEFTEIVRHGDDFDKRLEEAKERLRKTKCNFLLIKPQ